MSHDTTALVIAGGSFIGRHLCRRLRDDGISVRATGRGEELGYCDVGEAERVGEVIRSAGADWIFQCAAATTPDATPELMHRVHVSGTLNVLRAAVKHSPNAVVVLFGSAAEYGAVEDSNLPITEDQPTNPLTLFGASKAGQTHVALTAAAAWGLRVVVVRPFNVLGPGLPDHYLAGALTRRLLQSGASTESIGVANPYATRDFVDVRDVAGALVSIAERAVPSPGEPVVYNIASGIETPVIAVARELCALQGRRPAVAAGEAASRSQIRRSCGDASRLRRTIGWRPRVSWRESLFDLWESERKARAA
jgi:GDP-4-dehydro-6-deoxy-D-mannose reductase